MRKFDDKQIKAIEDRVYNLILKDFGTLYFENSHRIPVGTYVAPLTDEERPIIERFFNKKGWSYMLAANGLYYVRFPKPQPSV